jgi:hypothetical protein
MTLLEHKSQEWKKEFNSLLTSLKEAKKVIYPL